MEYFLDLSSYGQLSFLTIVGAVGVVVGGIPAFVKYSEDKVKFKWITVCAVFVYGLVSTLSAALFLLPIFSNGSGLLILTGIIFASMLFMRVLLFFPNNLWIALRIVLVPLLLTFAIFFLSDENSYSLESSSLLGNTISQLSLYGFIIFTGFWCSWPFFFFSIKTPGALKENLKVNPVLSLFGLGVIFFFWCAGLYFSYLGALNLYLFPTNYFEFLLIPGGLLLQVVSEAKAFISSYPN